MVSGGGFWFSGRAYNRGLIGVMVAVAIQQEKKMWMPEDHGSLFSCSAPGIRIRQDR
jgi:hypothetical protein